MFPDVRFFIRCERQCRKNLNRRRVDTDVLATVSVAADVIYSATWTVYIVRTLHRVITAMLKRIILADLSAADDGAVAA